MILIHWVIHSHCFHSLSSNRNTYNPSRPFPLSEDFSFPFSSKDISCIFRYFPVFSLRQMTEHLICSEGICELMVGMKTYMNFQTMKFSSLFLQMKLEKIAIFRLFFELYAFIILTSTLVLGINYFVIITRPLHQIQVLKRFRSSCYMFESIVDGVDRMDSEKWQFIHLVLSIKNWNVDGWLKTSHMFLQTTPK